jgi:hypothetical protein
MLDDDRVGFWGGSAGWGLYVNIHDLRVTTAGSLDVGGASSPLPSWSGGGVGTWDVFSRGGVYCGATMAAPKAWMSNDGSVFGTSKHFLIDHPLDPERRWLRHTCIEGPEAAVFYRGEGRLLDGTAEVCLPQYFEALTRAEGRTVQLTPVADAEEAVSVLAATRIADGRFTVRAADDRNPSQAFCWEVTAVRADIAPIVAESDKAAGAAWPAEMAGATS